MRLVSVRSDWLLIFFSFAITAGQGTRRRGDHLRDNRQDDPIRDLSL